MSKTVNSFILSLAIIVSCLFGFSACKGPLDDLSIDVTANNITKVEGGYQTTLILGDESTDRLSIRADISGAGGDVSKQVVWSTNDNDKVQVTGSKLVGDHNFATIVGKSVTQIGHPARIVVSSIEKTSVNLTLFVNVVAEATKVSARNNTAIAVKGTVYEPNVMDFFTFTNDENDSNVTVPNYTYELTVDGEKLAAGAKIPADATSMTIRFIPSDNEFFPESEIYSTRVLEVESSKIILYENLEEADFDFVIFGTGEQATNDDGIFELVINKDNGQSHTYALSGFNTETMKLSYKVLPEEFANSIQIDFDSSTGELMFMGQEETGLAVQPYIEFTISYKDQSVISSGTYRLPFAVVSYPDVISINGHISMTEDCNLTVYNNYVGKGESVAISISPYSTVFKNYVVKYVGSNTDSTDQTNLQWLVGDSTTPVFVDNKGTTIPSGTKLFLLNVRNEQGLFGNGILTFEVYVEGAKAVSKTLNVKLDFGIEGLEIAESGLLDSATGNFVLSLSQQQTEESAATSAIKIKALPDNAAVDSILDRFEVLDPTIVAIDGEPSVEGNVAIFNLKPLKAGTTSIVWTAPTGATYTQKVFVFNQFVEYSIAINGQSGVVGEINYKKTDQTQPQSGGEEQSSEDGEEQSGEESAQTSTSEEQVAVDDRDLNNQRIIESVRIATGSTIDLSNTLSPQNAYIQKITYQVENPNIVSYVANRTNALGQLRTGDVAGKSKVVCTVFYYVVENGSLTIQTKQIEFDVYTYYKVKSLQLSDSNITLYSSTETSGVIGVYNTEYSAKRVYAYFVADGQFTDTSRDNVRWAILTSDNEDVEIEGSFIRTDDTATQDGMSYYYGSSILIKPKQMKQETTRTVLNIIASITDYNTTLQASVTITILRFREVESASINVSSLNGFTITQNNQAKTNSYNKNSGQTTINKAVEIYAEKDAITADTYFELIPTIRPSNATNKNLRYVIFDYEYNEQGDAILSPRNGEEYDSVSTSKLVSIVEEDGRKFIKVNYDEALGVYCSGRAVVYVLAEDELTKRVEEIRSFEDIEIKQSDARPILMKIEIVVADGSKTAYRIYNAQDFLKIYGESDKNYEIMTDIYGVDLSSLISSDGKFAPNFAGTLKSASSQGENESTKVVRRIVTFKDIKIERSNGQIKYGIGENAKIINNPIEIDAITAIFGNLSGVVSDIDIIIPSYTYQIKDNNSGINQNISILASLTKVENSEKCGKIENVNLTISELTVDLSGYANTTTLNFGAIAQNSGEVKNLSVLVSKKAQFTACNSANFTLGVAQNNKTISELSVAGNVEILGTGLETEVNFGGAIAINKVGAVAEDIESNANVQSLSAKLNSVGGVVAINEPATTISAQNIPAAQITDARYLVVNDGQNYDFYGLKISNAINLGGVVGDNQGAIEYAYAASFVDNAGITADNVVNLGGVAGYNNGAITKVFASIEISQTSVANFDNIANNNEATNYYYIAETSGSDLDVTETTIWGSGDIYTGAYPLNGTYYYLIKDGKPYLPPVPSSLTSSTAYTILENLGIKDNDYNYQKVVVDLNAKSGTIKETLTSSTTTVPTFSLFTWQDIEDEETKINPGIFSLNYPPLDKLEYLKIYVEVYQSQYVLKVLKGVNATDFKVQIFGKGTAVLKIVSALNKNAFVYVQVCVLDGFANFTILNEETGEEVGNLITLKQNVADQFGIDYKNEAGIVSAGIINSSIEVGKNSNDIRLTQTQDSFVVSGSQCPQSFMDVYVKDGTSFVKANETQLENDEIVKYYKQDDQCVITDFEKIYARSEQGLKVATKDQLLNSEVTKYYISASLTFTKIWNAAFVEIYVNNSVSGYVLATNDNLADPNVKKYVKNLDGSYTEITNETLTKETSLSNYAFEPIKANASEPSKQVSVNVVKGPTAISLNHGDLEIYAGDRVYSTLTITTDDEFEGDEFNIYIDGELYATLTKATNGVYIDYKGEQTYTINATIVAETNVVTIDLEYYVASPADIISEKQLNIKFEAKAGDDAIVDCNYNLNIMPQVINSIDMYHYVDVIQTNEKGDLSQAGETPSSNLVAGSFGLLKVTIDPWYVDFDRVEVRSDILAGGYGVTFDQRVLNVESQNYQLLTSNEIQVNQNSISTNQKRSTTNRDFEGIFYFRTFLPASTPANSVFNVYVTFYDKSGNVLKEKSKRYNIYAASNLSISYDNYVSSLDKAYIALNTGGEEDGDTYKQNANILRINAEASLRNVTLKVKNGNGEDTNATNVKLQKVGETTQSESGEVRWGEYLTTALENAKVYVIVPADGNACGKTFTITLEAQTYISGILATITREMKFEIVDFVINAQWRTPENSVVLSDAFSSLGGAISDVSGNNWNYVFSTTPIQLTAFATAKRGNIELSSADYEPNENTISLLRKIPEFSFDLNNSTTCAKVLKFLKEINNANLSGSNEGDPRSLTAFGYMKNNISENWPKEKEIVGSAYLYTGDGSSSSQNARPYFIEGFDISKGSPTLTTSFYATYSSGVVSFAASTSSDSVHYYTQFDIAYNEQNSNEHPIPIYNLDELKSMQAGYAYILMNDIDLGNDFAPLSVAIASLDGNNYNLELNSAYSFPSDGNVGLFSVVDENTILKNITIKVANAIQFNCEEAGTDFNIGLLAGINNGTITNCKIISEQKSCSLSANADNGTIYFGGLVGQNSGYITNSRIDGIAFTANFGVFGGFIGQNNLLISGCYVNNASINYQTVQQVERQTMLGGFVGVNEAGGSIFESYIGGLTLGEADKRSVTISSNGKFGAFVYDNSGSIYDCYTSATLNNNQQDIASGFVFTNSGDIARTYAACVPSQAANSEIRPYIGTTTVSGNERPNNSGTIKRSFFYSVPYVAYSQSYEVAAAIDFAGMTQVNADVWSTFSFASENGDDGIWRKPTENEFGPQLVNANIVGIKEGIHQEISKIESTEGGAVYYYTIKQDGEGNVVYNTKDFVALISSAEEFNNIFDFETTDDVCASDTAFYARIIKPIDLSTLAANNIELKTITKILRGKIVGNNLSISGVDISYLDKVSNNSSDSGLFVSTDILRNNDTVIDNNIEHKVQETDVSVGLFGEIRVGSISNLNFELLGVYANNPLRHFVGGIAGRVVNGNLFNITLTGDDATVLGYNIVGGVAGAVLGNSQISNITVEGISVTSDFEKNGANEEKKIYNFDLARMSGESSVELSAANELSIAGGLFGIVDLFTYTTIPDGTGQSVPYEEKVLDASRSTTLLYRGSNTVLGQIAGGVAGVVGTCTTLYDARHIVGGNSAVKASVYAGGLVGQNNGAITYSSVEYESNIQTLVNKANTGAIVENANAKLFNSISYTAAVGGLVGANFGRTYDALQGGSIRFSTSSVYVDAPNAQNVGGLVGVVYGGDIRAVYATGYVLGYVTSSVGGLVGTIDKISNSKYINTQLNIPDGLWTKVLNPYTTTNGTYVAPKDGDQQVLIDFGVAQNNWASAYYSKYSTIQNYGYLGGYVGYVVDTNLFTTSHNGENFGNATSADETICINYYVNAISKNPVATTANNYGNDPIELLVANVAHDHSYITDKDSINDQTKRYAIGETRNFAVSKTKWDWFALWDSYSIAGRNDDDTPQIQLNIAPATMNLTSVKDFMNMYWHPDRNFELENDVNFNGNNYIMAGSITTPFTGELDGKGYAISNISVSNYLNDVGGLFGVVKGATIHDVVINNITIINQNGDESNPTENNDQLRSLGGLIGYCENATISNVVVTGVDVKSVLVNTSESKVKYVGGLVGYASDTTFNFVAVEGANKGIVLTQKLKADTTNTPIAFYAQTTDILYVGGFVGFAKDVTIENDGLFNVSNINITNNNVCMNTNFGGVAGTAQNVKANGLVSAGEQKVAGTMEENAKLFVGGIYANLLGTENTLSASYSYSTFRLTDIENATTANTTISYDFNAIDNATIDLPVVEAEAIKDVKVVNSTDKIVVSKTEQNTTNTYSAEEKIDTSQANFSAVTIISNIGNNANKDITRYEYSEYAKLTTGDNSTIETAQELEAELKLLHYIPLDPFYSLATVDAHYDADKTDLICGPIFYDNYLKFSLGEDGKNKNVVGYEKTNDNIETGLLSAFSKIKKLYYDNQSITYGSAILLTDETTEINEGEYYILIQSLDRTEPFDKVEGFVNGHNYAVRITKGTFAKEVSGVVSGLDIKFLANLTTGETVTTQNGTLPANTTIKKDSDLWKNETETDDDWDTIIFKAPYSLTVTLGGVPGNFENTDVNSTDSYIISRDELGDGDSVVVNSASVNVVYSRSESDFWKTSTIDNNDTENDESDDIAIKGIVANKVTSSGVINACGTTAYQNFNSKEIYEVEMRLPANSIFGGIAGTSAGLVNNCWSHLKYNIKSSTDSSVFGGIVGETQGGTIANVNYYGNIDGSLANPDKSGGIVGTFKEETTTSLYKVLSYIFVYVGQYHITRNDTNTNAFNLVTDQVIVNNETKSRNTVFYFNFAQDGGIGTKLGFFEVFTNISGKDTDGNFAQKFETFYGIWDKEVDGVNFGLPTLKIEPKIESNDGLTKERAIEIPNEQYFAEMLQYENFGIGRHYILTKGDKGSGQTSNVYNLQQIYDYISVNFGETSENAFVDKFAGHLDGNNKILRWESGSTPRPLIGQIVIGQISDEDGKNIATAPEINYANDPEEHTLTIENNSGGIFNLLANTNEAGNINRIIIKTTDVSTASGNGQNLGILVGTNSGNINDCTIQGVTITITASNNPDSNIGFIAGLNSGNICKVLVGGTITTITSSITSETMHIGGIAGESTGTILSEIGETIGNSFVLETTQLLYAIDNLEISQAQSLKEDGAEIYILEETFATQTVKTLTEAEIIEVVEGQISYVVNQGEENEETIVVCAGNVESLSQGVTITIAQNTKLWYLSNNNSGSSGKYVLIAGDANQNIDLGTAGTYLRFAEAKNITITNGSYRIVDLMDLNLDYDNNLIGKFAKINQDSTMLKLEVEAGKTVLTKQTQSQNDSMQILDGIYALLNGDVTIYEYFAIEAHKGVFIELPAGAEIAYYKIEEGQLMSDGVVNNDSEITYIYREPAYDTCVVVLKNGSENKPIKTYEPKRYSRTTFGCGFEDATDDALTVYITREKDEWGSSANDNTTVHVVNGNGNAGDHVVWFAVLQGQIKTSSFGTGTENAGKTFKASEFNPQEHACNIKNYKQDETFSSAKTSFVKISINAPNISYVGGIAGKNSGQISNFYVDASISANRFVGGVAGINSGQVKNCLIKTLDNNASISANSYVGGVAGLNNGWIYNTTVEAKIDASTIESSAGGIAGANQNKDGINNEKKQDNAQIINPTVKNSTINGIKMIAGIAGYNSGEIKAGLNGNSGVIELNNTTITTTWTKGENQSDADRTFKVGYVVAENWGTISFGTDTNALYLINSQINVNFNGYASTDTIPLVVFAGGIAGLNAGTIDGTNITSKSANGTTEKSALNLKTSFITKTTSNKLYVGGIAGENIGRITNIKQVNLNLASANIAVNSLKYKRINDSVVLFEGDDGYNNIVLQDYPVEYSPTKYVGGVAAVNSGYITGEKDSSVKTNLNLTDLNPQYVGGIVAYNQEKGVVFNISYNGTGGNGSGINAGAASKGTGGIVGQNAGYILNAICNAYVTTGVNSINTGGIAGINLPSGIIAGCRTLTSTIEGYENVGGIAGTNEGKITNSKTAGGEGVSATITGSGLVVDGANVTTIANIQYDENSTYEVGDRVFYYGKLYSCKTAIETGEIWNPEHWEETTPPNISINTSGTTFGKPDSTSTNKTYKLQVNGGSGNTDYVFIAKGTKQTPLTANDVEIYFVTDGKTSSGDILAGNSKLFSGNTEATYLTDTVVQYVRQDDAYQVQFVGEVTTSENLSLEANGAWVDGYLGTPGGDVTVSDGTAYTLGDSAITETIVNEVTSTVNGIVEYNAGKQAKRVNGEQTYVATTKSTINGWVEHKPGTMVQIMGTEILEKGATITYGPKTLLQISTEYLNYLDNNGKFALDDPETDANPDVNLEGATQITFEGKITRYGAGVNKTESQTITSVSNYNNGLTAENTSETLYYSSYTYTYTYTEDNVEKTENRTAYLPYVYIYLANGGTITYNNGATVNVCRVDDFNNVDDKGNPVSTFATQTYANDIGDYVNYSSSSTYKVGDRVKYNNELYRCKKEIETAEQWNAENWTRIESVGTITQFKGAQVVHFAQTEVKLYKAQEIYANNTFIKYANASLTRPVGVDYYLIKGTDSFPLNTYLDGYTGAQSQLSVSGSNFVENQSVTFTADTTNKFFGVVTYRTNNVVEYPANTTLTFTSDYCYTKNSNAPVYECELVIIDGELYIGGTKYDKNSGNISVKAGTTIAVDSGSVKLVYMPDDSFNGHDYNPEDGYYYDVIYSGQVVTHCTRGMTNSGYIDITNQTIYCWVYPNYSSSSTYAVGDKVVYNDIVYECNTAIETPEAWTVGHWTETTESVNYVYPTINKLTEKFKQPSLDYSSEATYKVGDLVKYNDEYYICITAIETKEEWNSAHWSKIPSKANNVISGNDNQTNYIYGWKNVGGAVGFNNKYEVKGETKSGHVENVTVQNVTIYTYATSGSARSRNIGGFVGYSDGNFSSSNLSGGVPANGYVAQFKNCEVNNLTIYEANHDGDWALKCGGFAGFITDTLIQDCDVTGTINIDGAYTIGGFVGQSSTGANTVSNIIGSLVNSYENDPGYLYNCEIKNATIELTGHEKNGASLTEYEGSSNFVDTFVSIPTKDYIGVDIPIVTKPWTYDLNNIGLFLGVDAANPTADSQNIEEIIGNEPASKSPNKEYSGNVSITGSTITITPLS